MRQGALVLRNTLPYMPPGVHWPWWTRRWAPSAAPWRCDCGDGRMLVGPDNGLLSLAWQGAGGVEWRWT